MKSIKFPILAILLFFVFLPSFEMSHAGQIAEAATLASEVAKTANPSVGSGDWIGSSSLPWYIFLGFWSICALGIAWASLYQLGKFFDFLLDLFDFAIDRDQVRNRWVFRRVKRNPTQY